MDESTFLNPAKALSAAKMHEGMMVADFGAGSGFFTRAAAREVGDRGVVWAVDANRDMLPRIKSLSLAEGLHNVEVIHGDVERPGGSNLFANHFDLVIATNLLFYTENKDGLAREIARVLKRGGRALVIDWSGSHGGLGPHPDHVLSQAAARELFEKHGLIYLEPVPAGQYHWGFLVRKKG